MNARLFFILENVCTITFKIQPIRADNMSIQGNLDRFDNTIAGWAFDNTLPGKALDIVVEHEGVEIYRSKAELYRSDLVDAIGEGDHGFSFDLLVARPESNELTLSVYACSNDNKQLLGEGFWKVSNTAVEGLDDWLFLNKDSNDVNAVISGETIIPSEKIHEGALLFVTRSAMLEKMQIPYQAIIMPEKNVVCAQYRINAIISNNRPALLIKDIAEGFSCKVEYPIQEFSASPSKYFAKTDTHANGAGYKLIFSILQRNHPEIFGEALLPEPSLITNFCGDLGNKFVPRRYEDTQQYEFPLDSAPFEVDNPIPTILESGVTLRGSVVKIKNSQAKQGKLLIFGTSSAYNFLPVISMVYSEVLFVWNNTFDYILIKKYHPDFVLWLSTERFLPATCNDLLGLPNFLTLDSGK